MDERTILITERGGTYHLQNNGIPEFALIGILECILFDLKSAARQSSAARQQASLAERIESNNHSLENPSPLTSAPEETEEAEDIVEAKGIEEPPATAVTNITENLKVAAALEPSREVPQLSTAPDVRTRIGNAVKAIRGLGAQIEDADLTNLTEEELQMELEELTNQYKRLKSSKGMSK